MFSADPDSLGAVPRSCRWVGLFLAFVTLLTCVAATAFATSDKQLSKHYREWLNKDVLYIITHEERQAFLQLSTDEARDAYIERFWAIRNPTPGAPTNPYREEHYARLQYASQYFGHKGDGWSTAMGRVYITLGKPAQRGLYHGLANVRPMEIWFYENSHPALPPFFYVVFYQRDAGDDYRLYSPYMDGPDKLANAEQAINNRQAALQVIDQAAGREVARISLSLLPNEPVDMDTATSSLASDVLINTIKGLADHPFNKDLLNEHQRLLESVSHRILISGDYLEVTTMPLVDRKGDINLHYLLRLKRPEDFSLTETKDGRYYYSAQVAIRVLTPDGKEIFSQHRELSEYVSAEQMEQIKHKVFGYQGVLPLPAGKYKLDFVLTNSQTRTGLHAEKEIEIPAQGSHPLWLTPLMAFSQTARQPNAEEAFTPFLAAGLRFTPVAKEPVELVAGQPLQFFYQIWTPGRAQKPAASKLQVQISYGRLGMHDIKTIDDELARDQFAENGTMVNGKVIPTLDMAPGNYRVSVTVTDPDSHERASSIANVRISSNPQAPGAWDVADPEAAKAAQQGELDLQRAEVYLAQGKQKEALPWLKVAFDKQPQQEQVRSRLVDVLFSTEAFAQVADVYRRAGVTEHTEERTVLAMAESLQKIGDVKTSAHLLESAITLRGGSGPLYLALTDCYQRLGENQKASEAQQKAKSAMAAAPRS